MAERISKEQVHTLFKQYVEQALGGRVAEHPMDNGGYILDKRGRNKYRVLRITNDDGGARIVDEQWRNAREMYDAMWFAIHGQWDIERRDS